MPARSWGRASSRPEPILYGAETPFKAVVESYDDALAHMRRQKAMGAFSVKSYNQQRRDARQMLIKAARELR